MSSKASGRAVPLLDGNMARVLCRQLGLFARLKEKRDEDTLWDATNALVKGVGGEAEASHVLGSWNQVLMELGSTVCTRQVTK